MIANLSEIAAVAGYMQRVGAEVRALRTAVIRERDGRYFRDLAVIRLGTDGQVTVTMSDAGDSAAYEPTEIERHAIKIEAAAAVWPEHIRPNVARNLPDEIKQADPDDVFEFCDDEGKVIMLQCRRARADGGKDYLPFTYWSDNAWRNMEPDGELPLWGVDQLAAHATVFIHEGAKAARTIRRIVEAATPEAKAALAAHPWGKYLSNAAHVGWIGGALVPHRTDWSPLKKHGVTRVIIVADNDPPGHAAVPKIARALRTFPMKVETLRFDNRFPAHFDLADAFPPSMFVGPSEARSFAGPLFIDCVQPATWATRVGQAPPASGRGRPAPPPVILRLEFIAQWFMVVSGGKIMFVARHDPTRLYSEEEFNTLARPFSGVARLSDLFKIQGYEAVVAARPMSPATPAGSSRLQVCARSICGCRRV